MPISIDELKTGSPDAFQTLIDQFAERVVQTCHGFVRHAEDAEDIAQEVFLEVYRSVRRFRGQAKLETWIYRICVNKSLDHLRQQRRKKRLADLRDVFFAKHKTSRTPHDDLVADERNRILDEQIETLAENQRIALVLSQYTKLTNKQIAGVMGITEAAVESLLHRARANLKKRLAHYFEKKG